MRYHLDPKTLDDFKELRRVMGRLAPAVQDTLYGEASFAAAKHIAKVAQGSNRFKDKSGTLRKRIGARRIDVNDGLGGKIKKGGAIAAMFAPHGHIIEFGTTDRVQTSTGRATGRVDARNVMSGAFDTDATAAGTAGLQAATRAFNRMIDAARGKRKLSKSTERALGA